MTSFPKSARLRRAGDFDRLRSAQASSSVNRYFALRWLAGSKRRLGVIVPARLMNAARRNFVKRRVREYFRLHPEEFPPGDCLVIARAAACASPGGAAEEEKKKIRQALKNLLERALSHCERSEQSK